MGINMPTHGEMINEITLDLSEPFTKKDIIDAIIERYGSLHSINRQSLGTDIAGCCVNLKSNTYLPDMPLILISIGRGVYRRYNLTRDKHLNLYLFERASLRLNEKMNIPSPTELKSIVLNYEEDYKISDCIYVSAIEEFRKIKDLSQLETKYTKRIIEPFLLTWGRMSRVLGKQGCEIIREEVIRLCQDLNQYRNTDLSTTDLKPERKQIAALFSQISSKKVKNGKIGPTATSKILHLLNPDFFPMWDSKMRMNAGLYRADSKDYCLYQSRLQEWIKDSDFREKLKKLKYLYKKSYLKLIDEYNWYKAWIL